MVTRDATRYKKTYSYRRNEPRDAGSACVICNTILNGVGPPADGLGLIDDWYIDTADMDLYGPKPSDAGPWPTPPIPLSVAAVTPHLPFDSIQFNNGGVFGGSVNLTFNGNTVFLTGSFAQGDGSIASGNYSYAGGLSNLASGESSHAEGYNVEATGAVSHAEGSATKASGNYSHAEGTSTIASGDTSHAEGSGTTASGNYSHAEGHTTTASGTTSHAEGSETLASGNYSHAEGKGTSATGNYSHAEGQDTIASGEHAHVEGSDNEASGAASHAEGLQTLASGNYSHAGGYNTTASGIASHAEGSVTTASGANSHAEGSSTVSSGDSSHAEGMGTFAQGLRSHAEGYETRAEGLQSHAEGNETKAYGPTSHAEGYQTVSSGSYSHAEGYQTIAEGQRSHAEGDNTKSYGAGSHAEGYNTVASGSYSHVEGGSTRTFSMYAHAEGADNFANSIGSHAEGQNTIAGWWNPILEDWDGDYAHSEGYGTRASGSYSHAEGQQTISRGGASHAEGYQTVAYESWSHAAGLYTIASGSGQNVVGKYNQRGNTDSLFIVGNGDEDVDARRSDIFLVNSGSVMIGSGTLASDTFLYVGTKGDATNVRMDGNLVVSGTVKSFNGFSGSLTKLVDGSDYLLPGTGITISTGSNGSVTITSTAITSPGGSDTQVQFNDGSSFAGDSEFTFNKNNKTLSVANAIVSGDLTVNGTMTTVNTVNLEVKDAIIGLGFASASIAQTDDDRGLIMGLASSDNAAFLWKNLESEFVLGRVNVSSTASLPISLTSYSNLHVENIQASIVTASLGFTGSLTKLVDGSDYLLPGTGITISTGSNGSITITSTAITSPASPDTGVQYNSGGSFAASSNFTYNGSGAFLTGTLAQGNGSVASGSYSHAEGNQTVALGEYSHTEGNHTVAYGQYSHAEGNYTWAGGKDSSLNWVGGYIAHAEGHYTVAYGDRSHAEGNGSQTGAQDNLGDWSGGDAAHAEGWQTIAFGAGSHAEGFQTKTGVQDESGNWSGGGYAHAEGSITIAFGQYSHAEGNNTIAFGDYSHAAGLYTIASGSGQNVVGNYNQRGNTDSLFIVGNGDDDVDARRSDIFLVNSGSVLIGSASLASDTFLFIGTKGDATNVRMDGNLVVSGTFDVKNGNNESVLSVNGSKVGIGTSSPTYKLEVVGDFAATTKSFVIDHPSKSGWKLRHGSLEGPENGVYVRGRTSGKEIDLPDYWKDLVDEGSITVQITPVGSKFDFFVSSIGVNKITVEFDTDNVEYCYLVHASRKDEVFVVEFESK